MSIRVASPIIKQINDSRDALDFFEKDASLFIIGHEHFNKSMTLDIENRLMHYMMSVERVKHVHNLRDNPQTSYYPMEELVRRY